MVAERTQVDNGSEFISKCLARQAYDQHATLVFSCPDKPMDNQCLELFNGSFLDECLNVHWFRSLTDAQQKIEHQRQECNGSDHTAHYRIQRLMLCFRAAQ